MKAITTKFHGPTDFKGSRYSATDLDGNKVVLSTEFELNSEGNHDRAAIALCQKMGWTKHNLMRSATKDGYVYVFDTEWNRVEINKPEKIGV